MLKRKREARKERKKETRRAGGEEGQAIGELDGTRGTLKTRHTGFFLLPVITLIPVTNNKHLISSSAIVVVLDLFPITPSPLPSPRRLLLGGYMSVSVEWALC